MSEIKQRQLTQNQQTLSPPHLQFPVPLLIDNPASSERQGVRAMGAPSAWLDWRLLQLPHQLCSPLWDVSGRA